MPKISFSDHAWNMVDIAKPILDLDHANRYRFRDVLYTNLISKDFLQELKNLEAVTDETVKSMEWYFPECTKEMVDYVLTNKESMIVAVSEEIITDEDANFELYCDEQDFQ